MQIGWLMLAALLEVGGIAAMRVGLRGRAWGYLFGALLLSLYGWLVNQPRLEFGHLLGLYIVLFFLASQLLAFLLFSERPPWSLLLGGGLIIAGGLVIEFGPMIFAK
jgi:small multidrug resistance family-3 protein